MHITWSAENQDGECPKCKGKTLLVYPCSNWSADSEEEGDWRDGIEISGEVTGHYCPSCDCLTSLSLNT